MGIQEDIRSFVVENFLFGDGGGLKDDSSFIGEGIVDSTGILQLVAFIQERYDVMVEDDELVPENLDSVQKVVAYVEGKKRRALQEGADAACETVTAG